METQLLSLFNYNNRQRSLTAYGTGIAGLDELMFADAFSPGSIWEICGYAGVGKSQLCHTIAFNFVARGKGSALYIDTKGDFSPTRMNQIKQSRNISQRDTKDILFDIKVERTLMAQGVIAILEELLRQLELGNVEVQALKLVIIDALPAVFMSISRGYGNRHGNCLLSKLVCVMHKLTAKYYVAFVLVNIMLHARKQPWENELECTSQESGECSSSPLTVARQKPASRVALGRYWSSIPRVRLLLEFCENASSSRRSIKVLKSCYTGTGMSCEVNICNAGVV